MKEDNGSQDVGATAFDMSNSQHPNYANKIYYGNQHVPKPTRNNERVNPSAAMNAVNEGK